MSNLLENNEYSNIYCDTVKCQAILESRPLVKAWGFAVQNDPFYAMILNSSNLGGGVYWVSPITKGQNVIVAPSVQFAFTLFKTGIFRTTLHIEYTVNTAQPSNALLMTKCQYNATDLNVNNYRSLPLAGVVESMETSNIFNCATLGGTFIYEVVLSGTITTADVLISNSRISFEYLGDN